MVLKFLNKLFGNYNEKEIKKIREKFIPQINKLEEEFQTLSDEEIKDKFAHWKEVLTKDPEKIDDYLIRVFAGVKNVSRRLLGNEFEIRGKMEEWQMVHFDVQLLGGIIINRGNVAEMKTGEGKTLVCTLPIILNALTGKGVHLITVNDYLAQRDAEWMKPLYEFCGLKVGVIVQGIDNEERKNAYKSDITYGTNNEFGFDYLRDNMAQSAEQIVQRGLNFAIVDEVDSILIDEARTPLIISAPSEESTEKYAKYSKLVPNLIENEDYNIDLRTKTVALSEQGISKIEKMLGIKNLYTDAGFSEVHHIEQALKAHIIFEKDKDYVVRNDEVMIVDEFTGRLMAGRRFSDGLHQSLEAKENVEIKQESKTLATITFQNYFRLYDKLSGMTGTAETEAEEFAKIYKLDTIVIPTNKNITRQDLSDKIFKNERGKFMALAKVIKELNEKGQPVLIGTISIEKSESLSNLLKQEKITHNVLNAKQHEREAEIVANAGQKGSVTIATNMAGRGTDIKINDEVKELGGLAVLGTERHESRRIDNQLRGRSGRQGDPGFTQFFVAMNDELMRRFGGNKMSGIMNSLGILDEEAIQNKMISRTVESAQKKIEAFHFDARKHVVQYDDIMNIHREKMYKKRRDILFAKNVDNELKILVENFLESLISAHIPTPEIREFSGFDEIFESIKIMVNGTPDNLRAEMENCRERSELAEMLGKFLTEAIKQKKSTLPEDKVEKVIKFVILKSIDEFWLSHINSMTNLRDRVALSGFAQKDPIMEYKREAYEMFKKLLFEIRSQSINNFFRVQIDPQFMQATDYSNAKTNDDQIDKNLGGDSRENTNMAGLTRAEKRRIKKMKN